MEYFCREGAKQFLCWKIGWRMGRLVLFLLRKDLRKFCATSFGKRETVSRLCGWCSSSYRSLSDIAHQDDPHICKFMSF
jgi:hypothetical protein